MIFVITTATNLTKEKCGRFQNYGALSKLGGILVCDDVNDNLAFKHFCESEKIHPVIVKTFDSQVQKYVGIAVKIIPKSN